MVPTVLRKFGGPKTLVAIPLRRGRVRDARKERQSLGRNANQTAARGDSRNELPWTLLPQAISRRFDGATPISC